MPEKIWQTMNKDEVMFKGTELGKKWCVARGEIVDMDDVLQGRIWAIVWSRFGETQRSVCETSEQRNEHLCSLVIKIKKKEVMKEQKEIHSY